MWLLALLFSIAPPLLLAQAVSMPDGFTNSAVASVSAPTAIAFTPDGRMLVASQGGALRVVRDGSLLAVPALAIPAAQICANSERGLLGVAVDPAFEANSFIYLYYTFRTAGSNCGSRSNPTPMNRVSRFFMRGDLVDPASETILLSNLPSWNGNHNGGDLQFGADGYLYISVGDSGCDPYGNGCAGANDAARDEHTLLGKILRIDRDGGIPPDNPFAGAGTQRCGLANAPAGMRCRETYAWGLRNPFRIAFERGGAGRLFILDVGQDAWEEIDLGAPGADYGWNGREGFCANGSRTDCPPPPRGVTDPVYAYPHNAAVPGTLSGGCNSLAGGAFVPPGAWPAEFDGAFLFADYVCGSIFQLRRGEDGSWRASDFIRGLGSNSAVHLAFGPFGGSQALYYTTYAGGGQVRRIAYAAGRPNAPPSAVIGAAPTSGPLPLTTTFSARGSSDPDAGDALTYLWDFGDQSAALATAALTTQHTYARAGIFTATLRARDSQGLLSQPASARIFAGNTPPAAAIRSPAASDRFAAGQAITLSASASDAEDGALPDSALTWTVILHHDQHTHPFLGPVSGNDVTFAAPAPEDLAAAATSYLEVRLEARDAAGETAAAARDLRPRLVEVTLESEPAGLALRANGFSYATPRKVVSWAGYALDLEAPDQDLDGGRYAFVEWARGGPRVVTPAEPVTLRARFDRIGAAATAVVSQAASLSPGAIAPSSLATLQGQSFSSATVVAEGSEGPWPAQAGGARILVEDAEGVSREAGIYFISPDSATFEVPAETKPGRALVRLRRDDGSEPAIAYAVADPVAPGVFTQSGDGKGLARGSARLDGLVTLLTAEPVPVSAALLLLTTGLRGAPPSTILATVGGLAAEVVGLTRLEFPGLDEVEIRIPAALEGRGGVIVQLTAAGKPANPVAVNIR